MGSFLKSKQIRPDLKGHIRPNLRGHMQYMKTNWALQRQRRRFQVTLPIRIWPPEGERGPYPSGGSPVAVDSTYTDNISDKGCYFHFYKDLPIGSKIGIEIELSGTAEFHCGAKVRCWGKVVRVERDPNGKRFGIACMLDCYHVVL